MDKDQLMAEAEQEAMKDMLRTMLDICHPRYSVNSFSFPQNREKLVFERN